ncbi:MAG: hemolysin family protein [Abditibacteriaceae bacterium]
MLIWIISLCIIFGLFLIAMFAASEGTLAATNRVRLRHIIRQNADEENSEAQYLSVELSSDDQRFIAGVTIAANIPLFVTAALSSWFLAQYYPENWIVILIGILPALAVTALFQVTPRLLLARRMESESMWWLKPARWIVSLLKPLVYVMQEIASLPLRSFGAQNQIKTGVDKEEDDNVQTAELRDLMESAKKSGVIGDHGGQLIQSIFDFGDTRIQEIMAPRTEIRALPLESTWQEVAALMEQTGYSRIPLYEENLDQVVGIIHAKDVLKILHERSSAPLQDKMRAPIFLPETLMIDQALASMRASRDHLIIAIDEFGGTAGLLTIEDIIEELVGEISDEHDLPSEVLFSPLNPTVAIIDGKLHVEELEELWQLELPEGDYDTIGGLVMDQLGRPPQTGDRVETPNAALIVLSMIGHRPHKLKVIRRPEESL